MTKTDRIRTLHTNVMAKKLSAIFNSLPPPKGKSVKNRVEFAKMINGTNVSRSEDMGSYDVMALCPSVPIPNGVYLGVAVRM